MLGSSDSSILLSLLWTLPALLFQPVCLPPSVVLSSPLPHHPSSPSGYILPTRVDTIQSFSWKCGSVALLKFFSSKGPQTAAEVRGGYMWFILAFFLCSSSASAATLLYSTFLSVIDTPVSYTSYLLILFISMPLAFHLNLNYIFKPT